MLLTIRNPHGSRAGMRSITMIKEHFGSRVLRLKGYLILFGISPGNATDLGKRDILRWIKNGMKGYEASLSLKSIRHHTSNRPHHFEPIERSMNPMMVLLQAY